MNLAELDDLTLAKLDDLSESDRLAILRVLLKRSVGGPHLFDEKGHTSFLSLVSYDPVKPEEISTISAVGWIEQRVRRIVILEPVRERIEITTAPSLPEIPPKTITHETGILWWKKKTIEFANGCPPALKRIEKKTEIVTPRSSWQVCGAFAGSLNLFPYRDPASLGGELFGPNGTLEFDAVLPPGIPFTINVRHHLSDPTPFLAVLLGDITKDKT